MCILAWRMVQSIQCKRVDVEVRTRSRACARLALYPGGILSRKMRSHNDHTVADYQSIPKTRPGVIFLQYRISNLRMQDPFRILRKVFCEKPRMYVSEDWRSRLARWWCVRKCAVTKPACDTGCFGLVFVAARRRTESVSRGSRVPRASSSGPGEAFLSSARLFRHHRLPARGRRNRLASAGKSELGQ